MTTTATATHTGGDRGVLSPGWAGTGVGDVLGEQAFAEAMLAVEAALARTQAGLGIIPPAAADAITAAAATTPLDLDALAAGVRATANPVVDLVRQLTAAVAAGPHPEAAEYVHRGCTSQDVLDSALMLCCARTFERLLSDLDTCATGLAALAERHRDTLMAGRTLTQHAVPITFGVKAAGWLQLVLDARDRCRSVAAALPASLGGAAGTLSAYAEYATMAGVPTGGGITLIAPFAAELGLRAPLVPWHAVRTPIADVAAALSIVTGALGKFALDVTVLTRTEIGEVTEPAAAGRGASSTMPQKHNPVLATLILTAARQLPAQALILFGCMVSEDERSAGGWHAEWQPLRDCLRLAAGAAANAAELATGLTVHPEKMRANLDLTGAAVLAERLGAALAPVLGKATAKRLLTEVSETADGTGDDFVLVLDRALRDRGHPMDLAAVRALADPAEYLGAAGELVDRVLHRHRGSDTP